QERQSLLLEYLKEAKKASVSDLSKDFNVSEATIRRDLTKLERLGFLVKTYGGAILSNSTQYEFSYNERLSRHVEEKERIGKFAATLVKPGESVFLDSGTTTLQIGRHLTHLSDLTIVTAGLAIVQELGSHENLKVFVLGGAYRPHSQDLVGPTLIRTLMDFSVDIAFLSVDGFDPNHGLSAADPNEAETVRAANRIASRSVVVCDSSKAGKKAFARICEIDEVDMIITDSGLSPDLKERIDKMNTTLKVI
ncbi:MAG: DeoR/GlpR transcriptional regulator, partial [Candidatus Omnitrophica bacterium]|nr:DeoR/GlpR transcriptional regulator [Candidatus Omnitrophota bacterium]